MEPIENNKLRIKDIYDLLSPDLKMIIKPLGRLHYYSGKMEDIPINLKEAQILEIGTKCLYESNEQMSVLWNGVLIIYVESLEEINEMLSKDDQKSRVDINQDDNINFL